MERVLIPATHIWSPCATAIHSCRDPLRGTDDDRASLDVGRSKSMFCA
jgi:hypothetical protein